jgi:hypothetical protein
MWLPFNTLTVLTFNRAPPPPEKKLAAAEGHHHFPRLHNVAFPVPLAVRDSALLVETVFRLVPICTSKE